VSDVEQTRGADRRGNPTRTSRGERGARTPWLKYLSLGVLVSVLAVIGGVFDVVEHVKGLFEDSAAPRAQIDAGVVESPVTRAQYFERRPTSTEGAPAESLRYVGALATFRVTLTDLEGRTVIPRQLLIDADTGRVLDDRCEERWKATQDPDPRSVPIWARLPSRTGRFRLRLEVWGTGDLRDQYSLGEATTDSFTAHGDRLRRDPPSRCDLLGAADSGATATPQRG
jgi:hypothetical protein